MNIPKTEFIKIFAGSFWSKLGDSLIPTPTTLRPVKNEFLGKLHDDLKNKKYYPDLPRGYIVSDKHNRVSRIVPVFDYRESCTYFFCVKQIEGSVAVNRVDGTFGGWTLGNPIKQKEEVEIEDLPVSGIPINSYNPIKWSNNWRDFQKRTYQYLLKGNCNYFLKFDIANFYDTINLHILEDKIRTVTIKEQKDVVEILFHFLQNWNRKFERYSRKTVGIPQDEIGDCSRILANFYLQDYDAFIKNLCDNSSAVYLRYADDQIIMSKDKETALDILFAASKELFKINLNINSSKVEEFDKNQFLQYWAFEIFNKLEDTENGQKINEAIGMYFNWLENGIKFRSDSVLKRIITVVAKNINLLDPHLRYKLFAKIYEPDFLVTLDYWWLDRLATIIGDKNELYKMLDGQIPQVRFNRYHYTLLKFYKKWRTGFSEGEILKQIDNLSIKMD